MLFNNNDYRFESFSTISFLCLHILRCNHYLQCDALPLNNAKKIEMLLKHYFTLFFCAYVFNSKTMLFVRHRKRTFSGENVSCFVLNICFSLHIFIIFVFVFVIEFVDLHVFTSMAFCLHIVFFLFSCNLQSLLFFDSK